jgi:signal transduction histidine kinase
LAHRGIAQTNDRAFAALATKPVPEQLTLLKELSKGKENHDFQMAVEAAARGYRLAADNHLEAAQASFAVTLGMRYADLGNYVAAKKYSLEALRFAVYHDDIVGRIWAIYPLSWIEAELGNMPEALQLADESLRLSKEIDNDTMLLWSHNMVGEIHRRSKHDHLAERAYLRAKLIGEKIPFPYGLSTIHHNLGLICIQQGRYTLAEKYLDESSDKSSSNVSNHFEGALAHCEIYMKTSRTQLALDSAMATMARARAQGARAWELAAAKFIVEAYVQLDQYELAWEYKRQADALEEEIKGERVRVELAGMDLRFENEHIKDENALLERLNRTQSLVVVFACIIILLLAVAGFILIRSNRRVRSMVAALGERNRKLDEAIHEKDMLMNVMAHDLKSPLGAISGLMTLIEDPTLGTEDRAQFIALMRRSLDRGNNLVSNLLELARLENDGVTLRREELDLTNMLGELLLDYKAIAVQKGILLDAALPAQAVVVHTDRILLRRILENLIGNAVKFTMPGKRILLALQGNSQIWEIHIKDEGPGISPEDQQKLFRKFQRLSAKPTGGESSSGLGLAIVKSLADKIGATIEVRSTVGVGTTFVVSLRD